MAKKSQTKTKYAGVYKNTNNGMYYFATKVKQEDGSFKSIKSKSIYDSPIVCYGDLIKLKEGNTSVLEKEIPIQVTPTINISKPETKLKPFVDVAEEWIDSYKSKTKKQTAHVIEVVCRDVLFGQFKDSSINFLCENKTIISFKQLLSDKPVGNAYRNRVLFIYKSIIEYSYYSNYISQKEYGLVKLLLTPFKEVSETKPSKRKKREKFFYTLEEFEFFVQFFDKEKELQTLLYLLFYGGFRIGEALALTIDDIDFELGFVVVSKSQLQNGEISTTKTANSIRRVYLPKSVLKRLKTYITRAKIKDKLFTINYFNLVLKLKEYSKAVNVDYLNPHGYRHSCCSFLFQKYKEHNIAIDFKQVADHLGDKVDTVLNVYYHIYGSEKTKIIDLID